MLTLRPDWLSVTGGAVAVDLLAQIHGPKLRNEATGCLIAASLDLLVATWPRKNQPSLQIETLSKLTWRVSDLYYMYLRANDDAALGRCIKLARSSELIVILPSRHEGLKRRLLGTALRHKRPPAWSFDAFISWRTTSATFDQGWRRGRALLQLLIAYNGRINAAGRRDSMLVDVPKEL